MNVRVWNIDKLKLKGHIWLFGYEITLESIQGPKNNITFIDVKYKKLDSWIVKEAAP